VAIGRIARLLIANRGEISVRIARTCREMGIRSIAVYSDADRDALHVRECDEAVHIGPAPARESYLDRDRILAAARRTRADAIHPGYGFLSENAEFAQACIERGLVFVGPSPAAMRAVGDKVAAKLSADEVGVPTVPGYLGEDQRLEALADNARRIGVPLLVKAAAGGGGKGMRLVRDLAQFEDAIDGAKREAKSAFNDDTVFLERYIESPRHVEVQILADHLGNAIELGERDCSIQRRHQKIVEESPSPAVSPALRARLGDAALRIAGAVGYTNAGTVEFMLDAAGAFYFLEVNARLQVEHPVTETVTGLDLVRAQLEIASGKRLSLEQESVQRRGHAIEVRLYAEDPDAGFLPSSGRILSLDLPSGEGVRVDAGVAVGSLVTSDYDPMLAKIIVSGHNRAEALERMRQALDHTYVAGIATNVEFLRWIAAHPVFAQGGATTDFLERYKWPGAALDDRAMLDTQLAAAGALQELSGWRLGAQSRVIRFAKPAQREIEVEFDWRDAAWRARADSAEALIKPAEPAGSFKLRSGNSTARFEAWRLADGIELAVGAPKERRLVTLDTLEDVTHAGAHALGHTGAGSATAPMTGTIVKVAIRVGDEVKAHETLALLEAMKMEHAVAAPYDGRVTAVFVKPGDRVDAGVVLAEIEPST